MQGDNLERLTIEKAAKEKKTKRTVKTSYLVVCAAAAIAVVAAVAFNFLSKGREVKVARVSEVYPAQMLSQLNASGYVVAQRKADVASKITGQLVAIMVQEGSVVKGGQLIAQLENEDAKAQVDQGRANLMLARARMEQARAELENVSLDFERKKHLVAGGAVSRSEFDAAEARHLSAKAALDAALAEVKSSAASLANAQTSLSYSEIRAPFDAVVLTKNADVGDIITPFGAAANAKAAVVSIADLASLQVEVDVSEANIGSVHIGQPCDILLDALPDRRFRGVVDTIVPTVDRSKATVLVKVRFAEKDARILPEMSAKVGFLGRELSTDETRPRIMVSKQAVQKDGAVAYVFLVEGEKVRRRSMRPGSEFGDMLVAQDGLKPGDTVVIDPPKGLRNGSRISILQQ